MTAIGIHAHPHLKLGARPENTAKPKVAFSDFLTAVPSHPLTDLGPKLAFDMDQNQVAGVCAVAAVNHALQVIYSLLQEPFTPWTYDQILAYYQTQNPGFRSWADGGNDALDGGMIIADFLSYLVKQGVILAFAKVDHTNDEELQAAIYLGLCLVSGANLQVAQQNATVWDDVPGSPDWGGHATAQDGYMPAYETISWGSDRFRMTPAFMTRRVSEVYLVITQAHIDHPGFRENLSLDALTRRLEQLTGRMFHFTPTPPVPPGPPAPPPAPAPAPGASFELGADVAARIDQVAARQGMLPDAWLEHHLRAHFGIR